MLGIRLLGDIEVMRDGERQPLPPSRKTRALLAYLALAGRPLRRDRLCAVFWEVPDDPKGALRWSLSRLRPILDEPGRPRILATRETVAFDPAGAVIDFAAAKALLARGAETADTASLVSAEREFRGEFLEGLELGDCHEFEAWRIAVREEARRLHATLLALLVERLRGSPETALPHARSAVRLDPADGATHAMLLRLLVEAGQREVAEEQFAVAMRQLEAHGVPTGPLLLAWREIRKPAPPVPEDVADATPPIPAPAPVSTLERKYVTVLSAGLSEPGTCAYTGDPELVLQRFEPLLDAVAAVVHRLGGTVLSRTDERVNAVFGAPVTHEDDAVRACFAALAARAAVEEAAPGVQLGMGLHSGVVVVRSMAGGPAAVEAVGPVVKVAGRVERAAAPGMVVITRETLRRAEGFVQARPVSQLDLGGEALPLHALEGKAPLRSRWQVRAARGLSNLVGRRADLEVMERALERAGQGHGGVVALVGEPGVGKSRLIHEFLYRAVGKGWTVHETSTSPHDMQATFLPVTGLLRDVFEIGERDSQAAVAGKLEARIGEWMPDPATHLPAFRTLLDLPVDDPAWTASSPQRRRKQTIDTIRALIAHRSRHNPLILVVEDLHWVDAQTQAVLDALVEGLGALRVLLLVTFRPGYRHDWGLKSYFTPIRLDPFNAAEVENFLEAALGGDHTLPALKGTLAARTEGTPLFLEEAIRALLDAGAIEGAPGSYRATTASRAFELPSSIQAVIASRIDRLPVRAKCVLQVAAVIGRDVPVALLRRVAGLPGHDLEEVLAELQSAEFLFETRLPPELEYTFKHALTHEVAYSSVLRERRRDLHVELVRTIEELYPDRLGEQVDHLARHAAAGGLQEKAIRYLFQAAGRAIRRSAHLQAADLLKRGLDIIAELPESPALLRAELDYQKALGVTMMAARGWGAREVSDAYTRARELSRRIGDDRELFVAMRGQGQFHMIRGELDTARAIGERCVALFSGSTDHGVHLETHHLFWSNSFFMGQFEESAHHSGHGIEAYERERDHGLTYVYSGHDPGVCCRAFSGLVLWHQGHCESAVARCREALSLAEELAHPLTLALAYWALSYLHLFRREPAEAQRWAEMEISVCERYLLPLLLSQGQFQLGWALAEQGQAAAGIARMEEGLDAIRATGAEMGTPYFIALLAEAQARRGRVDGALGKIDLAREASFRHGARFQLPEILRLKGEILLMGDDPAIAGAERSFREALSVARAQGSRVLELRSGASLARLLRRSGRAEEARGLLQPLAAGIAEGGDTPDLRDARQLVEG
jgi:DNA-binding SARP family transcriptional activator/predicted ATPase